MTRTRFQSLDSLRGVAALSVAFYHFMIIDLNDKSHVISINPFINHLWLLCDFFFVLSGFVLAHRYYWTGPTDFLAYVKARFFRLVPLHVVTTLVILILSLRPDMSIDQVALGVNLLNLQVFFANLQTFNMPSWSVSAEFFGSLIVGAVFFMSNKKGLSFTGTAITLFVVSTGILIAFSNTLNLTYGLGILRALAGLTAGVLTYRSSQKWPDKVLFASSNTILEICTIIIMLLCIIFYAQLWFVVPIFIFSIGVLVFSRESGLISSTLKHPVPLKLGQISYSIYLNHFIILFITSSLFGAFHLPRQGFSFAFSLTIYFTLLILLSLLTWNTIERPYQKRKSSSAP